MEELYLITIIGSAVVVCLFYARWISRRVRHIEKQKEQKPISQEDFDTAKHEALWGEQKPADDKAFEEWVDDWWKHNKVNNPDSYDKGDEIQFDERGFKNFCRGIRDMYAEQKLNIELIQRSWYMEGYHDREFGKEPKWILKTGEGGPKHELNPKYGQPLTWQQVTEEQLHNLNEVIKYLRMDGCERMADSLHSLYNILNTRRAAPAEWSEYYREEDIQTRFAFYTYKDDSSVLYLSNVFVEETSRNHGFGTRILRAAEKVAETIGAITISLKVKQDSPANAWYRKRGYGYVAFEDGYDWLEKNLEYLKPVKPAEWSEEDERMRNRLIDRLNFIAYRQPTDATTVCMSFESEIAWLKSLRPSWKPSEEQMKALQNAVALAAGNKVLAGLYEQLKAIKEDGK